VFISSIPAQHKLRVTTNATQKRPSATFDDPNIDWLSVQKDIVTQILWKTDFNDTDFAGWTYSGKAVSQYIGVATYKRYRWYELENDGSACIDRWRISPIRWAPPWRHFGSIFARHSGGLTLCISY
jgi:hypothetical protein